MRFLAVFVFCFSLIVLSSYSSHKKVDYNIRITRILIAKAGNQIVDYHAGFITKIYTRRVPLSYQLNKHQNQNLENEASIIDKLQLQKELNEIPEIRKDVYPKLYYRIITNSDTIVTKEFPMQTIPNQLKKIDKLMLSYSSGTY